METTQFFDLDFEKYSPLEGLPAGNYRGLPILWEGDEFKGGVWQTGEGFQDPRFPDFANIPFEIHAARVEDTAEPLYSHSFNVESNILGGREGQFGRFQLNKADEASSVGAPRVELSLGVEIQEGLEKRKYSEAKDSHSFYGFSVYIPEDWESDTQSHEVISQWLHHNNPPSAGPAVTLEINGEDFGIKLFDKNNIIRQEEKLGQITTGEWTDFVFEIQWESSTDPTGEGFIRSWVNSEKVADIEGPNAFNETEGVYQKAGIYKPDWPNGGYSEVNERVLYFDNFRSISADTSVDGLDGFDFVAPWKRTEISPPSSLLIISGQDALTTTHEFSEAEGFSSDRSTSKNQFFSFWPEQSWFYGDIDGDGFTDAINIYNNNSDVYAPSEVSTIFTHLSEGNGFTDDARFGQDSFVNRIAVPDSSLSEGVTLTSFDPERALIQDINGDGKDDIVNVINVNGIARAYVHTSNGFNFDDAPIISDFVPSGGAQSTYWEQDEEKSLKGQTWLAGDFDGDGRGELLTTYQDYVNKEDEGIVGNLALLTSRPDENGKFDGFSTYNVVKLPTDPITGDPISPDETWVDDVNGDERDDIILFSSVPNPDIAGQSVGVYAVYESTENGFQSDPSYQGQLIRTWQGQERKVADVNGDGKADIITLYAQFASGRDNPNGITAVTHLSTGSGFETVRFSDFTEYQGVTGLSNIDLSNVIIGDFG